MKLKYNVGVKVRVRVWWSQGRVALARDLMDWHALRG